MEVLNLGGATVAYGSLNKPREQPGSSPHAGRQCALLTLQMVQLPCAMLPRDVLPVGAAGQGHHGAQRGGPLTHLHLELGSKRRERGESARQSLTET